MCYSHQACCLLCYLCKINNGIHIYQFTFELVHLCFRRGCGLDLNKKYWRIDRFGDKKSRIGGFAYPYSTTRPFLMVNGKQRKSRLYLFSFLYVHVPTIFKSIQHKNRQTNFPSHRKYSYHLFSV